MVRYNGAAPVTRQSGKTKLVLLRRACNHLVQPTLFHSANVFFQKDPRAKKQYDRLRACGNTHARALRGVGDRMLELFVLLRSQSDYDPQRRLVSLSQEGTPPPQEPY